MKNALKWPGKALGWIVTRWNMFPWWAKIVIAIITVSVVLVPIYDQVVLHGKGGHDIAEREPTEAKIVDICPFPGARGVAQREKAFQKLSSAADDWENLTPFKMVPISMTACDGPPTEGQIQVRACTDLVLPDYSMGCPEGFYDTVGMSKDIPGAGVIYWNPDHDLPNTAHHVLGHAVLGFKHTTAATSWMHGNDHGSAPAGSLPTYLFEEE